MIITLCGSTKFKTEFEEWTRKFSLEGHIVLSVGCFTHADGLQVTAEQKEQLDELHLRKIDISDEIFVIDVDGYIGNSTAQEVVYALRTGKSIKFMSGENNRHHVNSAGKIAGVTNSKRCGNCGNAPMNCRCGGAT